MKDTGKIREGNVKSDYKVGKGKPPKSHQFSSSNQPKNRRTSRDIVIAEPVTIHIGQVTDRNTIRNLLNLPYQFPDGSMLKQNLMATFGESVETMTAGQVFILQLLQKGIIKNDLFIFEKLFNQAFGMPAQEIRAATVSKMIVEVVHDDRELITGIDTGIHPVD